MKREIEDKIFKQFKNLFPKGRNANPKKSAMNYGFCCDDGWVSLIWELCVKLENLKVPITIVQIKQKFGMIRCYVNPIESPIAKQAFKLINETELKSSKICEKCGNHGKLHQEGYMKTLCDKCYKLHLQRFTPRQRKLIKNYLTKK